MLIFTLTPVRFSLNLALNLAPSSEAHLPAVAPMRHRNVRQRPRVIMEVAMLLEIKPV